MEEEEATYAASSKGSGIKNRHKISNF